MREAVGLAFPFFTILTFWLVLAEWLEGPGDGLASRDWRVLLAAAVPAALVMLTGLRR